MSSQTESAHGKLSPVDQQHNAQRFMLLLFVTLLASMVTLFVLASLKSGDFSWHPLAHDIEKHSFESSVM